MRIHTNKLLLLALLFLAAFPAPHSSAETDYVARESLKKLERRVLGLEGGFRLRVLQLPGDTLWTEVPGWRTLELVPAGGAQLSAVEVGSSTARVVVTTSVGGGGSLTEVSSDGTTVLGTGVPTNALRVAPALLATIPTNFGYGLLGSGTTSPLSVDPGILFTDAPSDTNTYGRKAGAWEVIPEYVPTGSGFPLTTSVSAAWFTLSALGTASGSNAVFRLFTGDGSYITNHAGGHVWSGLDIHGDTTIRGDLVVTGTQFNTTTVNWTTNVNIGVTTTYVWETRYLTSIVYKTTIVYTNTITTNSIDTYVNAGGSFTMGAGSTFDATNAAQVLFPTFTSLGTNSTFTGHLDLTGVVVDGLPAAGATNIAAGSSDSYTPATATLTWNTGLVQRTVARAGGLLALASSTDATNIVISATNKLWRIDQTNVINTWQIDDISGLPLFGIQLERDTNEFAWPAGVTSSLPATANTTNLFILYRSEGGAWTVE